MMPKSAGGEKTISMTAAMVIMVAAVFVFGILICRYSVSPQEMLSDNRHSLTGSATAAPPPIDECISRCKLLLDTGVNLSEGICVISNIGGYGCAVSSNGGSPCDTADSIPQILLNASCEFIEVVR